MTDDPSADKLVDAYHVAALLERAEQAEAALAAERDAWAQQERARRADEPVFTIDQLGDRAFYKAHEAEIHRALREPGAPRIVNAPPIERPAPTYPAPVVAGWRAIGQDVFQAPERATAADDWRTRIEARNASLKGQPR